MNNKLASGMIALSLAASGSVIADDVELLDLDNLEISTTGETALFGTPAEPVSNVDKLKTIELAGGNNCSNYGVCGDALA